MENSPAQPLPTATASVPEKTHPVAEFDVQGIPAMLVWTLGGMALLMCLVAVGMGLYCYWGELHMAVKVLSLLAVPALLWGGYYAAARHGLRSAEVAAVFASLSWLVILVLVQCCVHALPLWQMGLIFVGGLLALPLLHPWRSAVVALAAGCVLELLVLWWGIAGEACSLSPVWLWVCLLSLLMLWAIGGAWCRLTSRSGYAPFGKLAPIAFSLFLCAFYALVIFPQYLLADLQLSGTAWVMLCLIWGVSVLVALPLHLRFARRRKGALFSYSLLAFGGISLVAVPLLMLVNMPLLTAPLAFAYALSMVYYGADYKSPWLMLAGCIAFFLSSLSIPLRLGVNPLGSAVILLLLGTFFMVMAFRLNAYRRRVIAGMQIARSKQESASTGN